MPSTRAADTTASSQSAARFASRARSSEPKSSRGRDAAKVVPPIELAGRVSKTQKREALAARAATDLDAYLATRPELFSL